MLWLEKASSLKHAYLATSLSDLFDVYTNGLLRFAGSADVISGSAIYFPALNMGIGIGVHDFLSSTMAELQTVALFLKCVPSFSLVVLHLDSQAAINVCMFEIFFDVPDFCKQYWIERRHIFNLIKNKDLSVYWVKVKSYSGISGNMRADVIAGKVAGSFFILLAGVHEHFLMTEDSVISDNAHHFDSCTLCIKYWSVLHCV
ncbi:hypothetical protein G9A89_023301 [Geosiphon pyriformis]|nr:hypothetical protein G9A89_023301 [Geosiphon pyriformis]